jgi:hypothetical protein
MHAFFTPSRRRARRHSPSFALALVPAIALVLGASLARALPVLYDVSLTGAAESPPNASPGTGVGEVSVDNATHQMRVTVAFSGLIGMVTASHIHAATAVAGTGTAGVATQTPTFIGFPSAVTAGSYDHTFDMTVASSYNATFLNNATNLGNTMTAEASLYQAMAEGKAYLNIHSSVYGGGEIRGFLVPRAVATENGSWGQVKALFR